MKRMQRNRWRFGVSLVFLLAACPPRSPAAENPPPLRENLHLRGSLRNARLQFERSRTGHVAFIGGSIPLSYANGRFVDPKTAVLKHGWKLAVPEWKQLKGASRSRFTQIPMLCAEESGAELTLAFTGTTVGAYVVAGPDAGVAEASVDGGPAQEVNLLHPFSRGLHYPRTVILATDLKPGAHTLTLRMSLKTQGAGHAMRIMQFVAN